MVKLNTLNTIIDDIMLSIRNGRISESENISRIQVEQWIHQYRAMLIKQDIDKGRDVNPSYMQELNSIDLVVANYSAAGSEGEGDNILVTATEIPKTIDFHFKSGIVSIMDLAGNEIQLMSEKRSLMQKYRRYTFYSYSAFIKGSKIYISGPGDITKINVRGIFEMPSSVSSYSADDVYPVPSSMIPAIKELIFSKEFKLQVPTDKTNDSNDDTQNAFQKSN